MRPVHPKADVARYGAPGSKIAGSRLVRDYCSICGEAMRVNPGSELGQNVCECYRAPTGGRSAIREDDGGPWQQNAVRSMEDSA